MSLTLLLPASALAGAGMMDPDPDLILDIPTGPNPNLFSRPAGGPFLQLANVGGDPNAIATGDFDNDSITDLAVSFDGLDGVTVTGLFFRRSESGYQKFGNDVALLFATGNFDDTGNTDVALTFDSANPNRNGTWVRTDSGYTKVSNFKATRLAVGNTNGAGVDELVVTFEESGDPQNTGTWIITDPAGSRSFQKIRNEAASVLEICGNVNGSGGDDVLVTYGTEGVSYAFLDGSTYRRISGSIAHSAFGCAEIDAAAGVEIVLTTPGRGTFWRNVAGGFTQIVNAEAVLIEGGNFDNDMGNIDDVAFTFSSPSGTWTYRNLTKPLVKENNQTADGLAIAEITGD